MQSVYHAYKTRDGKILEDHEDARRHELQYAKDILHQIFIGDIKQNEGNRELVIDCLEIVLKDWRGY